MKRSEVFNYFHFSVYGWQCIRATCQTKGQCFPNWFKIRLLCLNYHFCCIYIHHLHIVPMCYESTTCISKYRLYQKSPIPTQNRMDPT